MAELSQNPDGGKNRKIRSKKLNARIDLTAMVDLAFLLIMFFMLTTSLGKTKSMPLTMPEPTGKPMPVDENRTLTILIGAHDRAKCFMGRAGGREVRDIRLGTPQLREELVLRKKEAADYLTAHGKGGGLIVLIKPGKASRYGNLVDVLDEMAIGDIPSYAIVDADAKESALLK